MIRVFFLLFSLVISGAASAQNFEAGQRWSCVTDQGANAFLSIERVEGKSVSFSWGITDPKTNDHTHLCHKRDALSVREMKEFCKLLGNEFSEGHFILEENCADR